MSANSTFSVSQHTIDCLGGEDAARAFITRTMSEIKRNPHIPRSLRQQYLDDAICGQIDYLVERSLALRAAMREWNIYVAEVDGRGFTCLPMPERR